MSRVLNIKVKRVDVTLPLPKPATGGSVGFDLLCRKRVTVPAGKIRLVPVNLIVAVPKGYLFMIVSRSSLPLKRGLMVANGVGIIDQDYRGPEDEIHVQVYNFTDRLIEIQRAERLAQGFFLGVEKIKWIEVEEVLGTSRGGFGSTG